MSIENLEKEEQDLVEGEDLSSLSEDDFPDIDFDDLRKQIFGGGDDDNDDNAVDKVDNEDKEKEELKEKEKKEETKEAEEKQKREVKKELEGILSAINKDETLKSKGLEVKIEDFTEEELKALLQKGLRFYQAMDEIAKEREAVSSRMKALEEAVEYLQRHQQQEGMASRDSKEAAGQSAQLPEEMLEISEYDEPQVVALKTALKQLSEKVNSLSSVYQTTQTQKEQEALLKEIESLKEDYPLANVEEVLAVHFLSGGKIPVQKVMEASQKYYGSTEFVKRVFKAHPEVRQSIEEEMIKNYLAKQSGKKSTPKVKVSGISSKPVGESKPAPETINFDNVSEKAAQYLNELMRLNKEEEE